MKGGITKGDLVVVYWYDTVEEDQWTLIDLIELAVPPLAKSVGWFLSEDEQCIRVCQSVVDSEAGYTVIPKGMIKQIEKVRDDELGVPEIEE